MDGVVLPAGSRACVGMKLARIEMPAYSARWPKGFRRFTILEQEPLLIRCRHPTATPDPIWSMMTYHDPRDYALGQELRVRVLTTGAQTSGRHDLVDAFQLPDTVTPLHLHTRYEERLFVVDGACTVWIGSDTVRLGPGDYCAIPLHTPHAIKAGPDGCRSLLICSPAGFAELITRAATPEHLAGPDTEIDFELFTSVSAELGDQILGPPGALPADL